MDQPLPKRARPDHREYSEMPSHLSRGDVHRPQPTSGVNGVSARQGITVAADSSNENEPPASRANDWDTLVGMMTVIHAMIEKIYQAMTMLREAEVHDRQQWLAYAQRQREEAEQEVSGRAAQVFNTAMAEAEVVVQRRAAEVFNQNTHKAGAPGGHGQYPDGAVPSDPNAMVAAPRQGEGEEGRGRREGRHEEGGGDNQTCWNCGREATETCSRCKKARYCGVFCQRKDWRTSHHVECHPPEGNEEAAPQQSNAPVITVTLNPEEQGQVHGQLVREDPHHADRHPA